MTTKISANTPSARPHPERQTGPVPVGTARPGDRPLHEGLISLPEAADLTGRSIRGLIGLALRCPERLPVYAPARDLGWAGEDADGQKPDVHPTSDAETPADPAPAMSSPLPPQELCEFLTAASAPPDGLVPPSRRTPIEALLVPRDALSGLHLRDEPRTPAVTAASASPSLGPQVVAPTPAPPIPSPNDALLDYAAAAEFLGMPRGTLYNLVWEKRIPHIRLSARTVRFDRATLADWLDRRRVNVKG